VRITEKGKSWFVWKKQRLEATTGRVLELETSVGQASSLSLFVSKPLQKPDRL